MSETDKCCLDLFSGAEELKDLLEGEWEDELRMRSPAWCICLCGGGRCWLTFRELPLQQHISSWVNINETKKSENGAPYKAPKARSLSNTIENLSKLSNL